MGYILLVVCLYIIFPWIMRENDYIAVTFSLLIFIKMEEPIRRSFIFYKSFSDSLACMEWEDRDLALTTLFNYVYYNVEPDVESLPNQVKMFFIVTRPIIDNDIQKYENKLSKKRNYNLEENGVGIADSIKELNDYEEWKYLFD